MLKPPASVILFLTKFFHCRLKLGEEKERAELKMGLNANQKSDIPPGTKSPHSLQTPLFGVKKSKMDSQEAATKI